MMLIEIGSIPLFCINLKLNKEEELDMLKFIDKYKNKKGRIKSNINGFQSEDIPFISEKNSFLNFLNNSINHHVNIFSKEILKIKKYIELKSIWLNINKYKDYNDYHAHPGSVIAGTFYANVFKNCGRIKFFINDMIPLYLNEDEIINFNRFNNPRFLYTPNKFDLILFPSWIFHSVEPNMDKKNERISISFNCG